MKSFKIFLVILLMFVAVGCTTEGTGTGNPLHSDTPYDPDQGSSLLASSTIVNSVCNKIAACYDGYDLTNCRSSILPLTDYAEKMGVVVLPHLSVEEIFQAEASEAFIPNWNSVNACNQDIDGLSCESPEVSSAFNPDLGNPYVNSSGLLGPSCMTVF